MKPLHTLQEKKQDLYKNLLLVASLSAGISLCANYVSNSSISIWILLCGIACIIFVVIAYLLSFYKSKSFTIKVNSIFITNRQGELIPIKRYDISENMCCNLKSVFSENKVYKKTWEEAFNKEVSKDGNKAIKTVVGNYKIICFVGELIEYTFIEWFSTQLCDYFNSVEYKEVEILTREKISDYLLQNRVLEMISKPYMDRENFANHNSSSSENCNVCMIYSNDTIYHHLDLKLPKKSSMYKKDGILYIKNPNYTLKFSHNFSGFNSVTPIGFENLYLNMNVHDACVYEFSPTIEIKLNPLYFLIGKNWKYMNWIDLIGEKFGSHFSFKHFLKEIGYETALTNFILLSNKQHKQSKEQQVVATIKKTEIS